MRRRWMVIFCTVVFLAPLVAALERQQETATAPPTAPTAQSPAAPSSKPGKTKYSHVNDFLIRGTVFTDKALSFPGVELRVRRTGEKKFRWESYTNSRGEFALRVPRGSDYELVVRAKGFGEQKRVIEAKTGGNEQSVVFRMQLAPGGKG